MNTVTYLLIIWIQVCPTTNSCYVEEKAKYYFDNKEDCLIAKSEFIEWNSKLKAFCLPVPKNYIK